MTNEEKRQAVVASAKESIVKKGLGHKQAWLILALAKVINRFLDSHPDIKLEMTCVVLDILTEQMCIGVYDDADADGRIERVSQVTIQ